MNFEQINRFLILAEHKNVSAAADALYIGQSSLSKHILRLEDELGVKLFKRYSAGVELTDDGILFLSFAQNVYQEYELLQSSLSKSSSQIMITVMPYGESILKNMIKDFKSIYPHAEFIIQETDLDNVIKKSLHSNSGFALLPGRLTKNNPYDTIPLFSKKLCVLVSSLHPFSSKTTVSVDDLKNEDIVIPNQKSHIDLIRSILNQNSSHSKPRFTVSEHKTWLQYIADNKAISFAYIDEPALDIGDSFAPSPNFSFIDYLGFSKQIKVIPMSSENVDYTTFVKIRKNCSIIENKFWDYIKKRVQC